MLELHCCGYTAMASCSTADTMPRQCPFACNHTRAGPLPRNHTSGQRLRPDNGDL